MCLWDYMYLQVNSEGRLVLRPGTRFHLYVSSSPCGDARIFTLTDKEPEAGRDPHPHRLGRGVLRTKIESGEGRYLTSWLVFAP